MNIFTIILKNFKQHRLSTCLTLLSIAMGIALVVAVASIKDQIKDHFFNISSKYEVVIGAKGSPLQLVLNSMYFMGAPTGNIDYSFFDTLKESPLIQMMIPFSLGDHYKDSLIVGTSDDFFKPYNTLTSKPLSLETGKPFDSTMQVVLGNKAAKNYSLNVGDTINAAHGIMESAETHTHTDKPYTVVGILKQTNTPIDNTIFTDIRSVWHIHDHKKDHEHHHNKPITQTNDSSHNHHIDIKQASEEELMAELIKDTEQIQKDQMRNKYAPIIYDHLEDKQITSILVKLASPAYLLQIQRDINDNTEYQAANPAYEIQKLISIIGNIDNLLLIISFLVIIVAVISILISTYNTTIHRKKEIAIMRAIGASKKWVVSIIMLEILLICIAGWVAGLILGHILLMAMGPIVNEFSGIHLNCFIFTKEELFLFPLVIILGLLSSLLPAYEAYKTDVASNLVAKQ